VLRIQVNIETSVPICVEKPLRGTDEYSIARQRRYHCTGDRKRRETRRSKSAAEDCRPFQEAAADFYASSI